MYWRLKELSNIERGWIEGERGEAYGLEEEIDDWVGKCKEAGKLWEFCEFWDGVWKMDEDVDE